MECVNCKSDVVYIKSVQLAEIPWVCWVEIHRCIGGCGYEFEIDRRSNGK